MNSKLIFSGLRMYFYRLWYLIWSDGCLLYFKHVSLGFDVSFHNVLKHLWSLKLVSSLRTTLWKIVLKCKIVIFISPSIKYPINKIFSVVVHICKNMSLMEKFHVKSYKISGSCHPYLMDCSEYFASDRYYRDMKALKILASNFKHFRIYGVFSKSKIGVP